jgi:hypothetical protein
MFPFFLSDEIGMRSRKRSTFYEIKLAEYLQERYDLGSLLLPNSEKLGIAGYGPRRSDLISLPSGSSIGPVEDNKYFNLQNVDTSPVFGVVELYKPDTHRSLGAKLVRKINLGQAPMYVVDCRQTANGRSIKSSNIYSALKFFIAQLNPPPFRVLFVGSREDILFSSNVGKVMTSKQPFLIDPDHGMECCIMRLPKERNVADARIRRGCNEATPPYAPKIGHTQIDFVTPSRINRQTEKLTSQLVPTFPDR